MCWSPFHHYFLQKLFMRLHLFVDPSSGLNNVEPQNQTLLAAFICFASYRGILMTIQSDNGSMCGEDKKVSDVDWKFGPLYGRHYQGLAETSAESSKWYMLTKAKY